MNIKCCITGNFLTGLAHILQTCCSTSKELMASLIQTGFRAYTHTDKTMHFIITTTERQSCLQRSALPVKQTNTQALQFLTTKMDEILAQCAEKYLV